MYNRLAGHGAYAAIIAVGVAIGMAWNQKVLFCCAVVFLDADTVAVNNLDELFRCPGFCAVLRHSERFNSGVMVLRPSRKLFNDMLDRITTVSSYTGYALELALPFWQRHSFHWLRHNRSGCMDALRRSAWR
jgi:hypothetical protein